MLNTSCCLVEGLGLGIHSVSGWLMVMHTYLYYFSLSLCGVRLSTGVSGFVFRALIVAMMSSDIATCNWARFAAGVRWTSRINVNECITLRHDNHCRPIRLATPRGAVVSFNWAYSRGAVTPFIDITRRHVGGKIIIWIIKRREVETSEAPNHLYSCLTCSPLKKLINERLRMGNENKKPGYHNCV